MTTNITIKTIQSLTEPEKHKLAQYIDASEKALVYHTLQFNAFIDDAFGYPNHSLAAFDDRGDAIGFLPQWLKGKTIESVPWRDKGGPLANSPEVAQALVKRTRKDIPAAKGFVWHNAALDGLQVVNHLVNVSVDIRGMTREDYLARLNFKVRGKVKNGIKNGLRFVLEPHGGAEGLAEFYELFCKRRHELGVPTYPKSFFQLLFRHLDAGQIQLGTVRKDDATVGAIILLLHGRTAIDAYSATATWAQKLRVSDFMVFEAIAHAIDRGHDSFDFGADSPLQTNLIAYKKKWLGEEWPVPVSTAGNVSLSDHNSPSYDLPRAVIRRLPRPLFQLLSRFVVR